MKPNTTQSSVSNVSSKSSLQGGNVENYPLADTVLLGLFTLVFLHWFHHQIAIPVDNHAIKRAGPYFMGPRLGSSPVRSITQCLARRTGTNEFYTLKVRILNQLS